MGRTMQRVAVRRDAQLLHVRVSPKAHHELRKLSTRLSKPGSFVKMNDLAIEAFELLFCKIRHSCSCPHAYLQGV